jgi:parallel beta-helix repeat protein
VCVTACSSTSEPSGLSRITTSTSQGPSLDADPFASLACGTQVTSSVRLDADLACTGSALLVSGDDIVIDLNGHTLSGVGTGNGITVTTSHDITISGGTIRGFVSGIFASNSTGLTVRDNEFFGNREAVLLQATAGSVIKHNVVVRHLMRGFMVRPNMVGGLSTDNVIFGNVVSDTPTGIYLIRQPGNTIQSNTITGSTIAAIDLAEGAGGVSGNTIRSNHLVGSAVGIRFTAGWTDNTFVGNRIESNVCGTKGSSASNTLNGNVFSGNATDTCP